MGPVCYTGGQKVIIGVRWRCDWVPDAALVLPERGQTVSVDGVEVVLVRNAGRDDLRVHHIAMALGAALQQALESQ